MKFVEARGLSCPEPVILTRQAMMTGEEEYEIAVDNAASRENVTRFAEHQGYRVSVRKEGGDYFLSAKRQ